MPVIRARRAVVPGGVLDDAVVEVADGRVTAVGSGSRTPADLVLDHGVLAPGLVDLQVNGYYGTDFADASADDWDRITTRLPETGVTSLLPTLITAPVPVLAERLREVRAQLAGLPPAPRARVLGVHVEGPFLSERRRGAHDPALLCDPTPEAVDALLEAADGLLALLTLAPERSGALDAVRRLAQAGVLVSVGHSDATADQVAAAADAGARMVTHLFNGQRPLHHRDPGVVGQALADPRLTAGLILDLHHVEARVAAIALRAAPGRIALVTDALSSAGMPPGRYVLGGDAVVLRPGEPPRREDGTLAGSGIGLDEAVGHAVELGVDLVAAVGAATRVPADLLGRTDLGRIEPGATADLVWLGDDLRARATWVAGELAHGQEVLAA